MPRQFAKQLRRTSQRGTVDREALGARDLAAHVAVGAERRDGHVTHAGTKTLEHAQCCFDRRPGLGTGLEPNNLAAIHALKVYRTLKWGRNADLILTDNRSFMGAQPPSDGLPDVPGFPEFQIPPHLILLIFLPVLLTETAYFTSIRDFRRNLRNISQLAFSLVIITAIAVAKQDDPVLLGSIVRMDRNQMISRAFPKHPHGASAAHVAIEAQVYPPGQHGQFHSHQAQYRAAVGAG